MRINPRAIGLGLCGLIIIGTLVWGVVGWLTSPDDAPSGEPTTTETSSPTDATNEDPDLTTSSELEERVLTFMLLYQSPLSQVRSDALRLMCTGELAWRGLNAEYVPSEEAEQIARTTTVRIDRQADNVVTITSQDDDEAVVEATAYFIVERQGERTIRYSVSHVSEWNLVSSEWRLAAVLS